MRISDWSSDVCSSDLPGIQLSLGVAGLCVVAGLGGGLLAVLATEMVYFAEDTFKRLPIHWMWWPAIGGLIIGIGGLFEPRAMGGGYDVIRDLLQGHARSEEQRVGKECDSA